jgi:hypothetical protein
MFDLFINDININTQKQGLLLFSLNFILVDKENINSKEKNFSSQKGLFASENIKVN